MDDYAENITPDQFPEVPPTKYLSLKMLRAQARQINRVQEAQGGRISANQVTMRQRLLKKWDRLPMIHRISILEDLTHLGLSLALVLTFASPAMAEGDTYELPKTAYEKPTGISVYTVHEDQRIVALVHSWQPPKGSKQKKLYFYRLDNGLLFQSEKRYRKHRKVQVIDQRPLAVVHPKLERWRQRMNFFGPFWQLGTDTAVKAAAGAAISGAAN